MKRTVAVVVVVLVVLSAALWFWRGRGKSPAPGGGAGSGSSALAGPRTGGRTAVDDPRTQARASLRGTVRAKGGGPLAGAQVCSQQRGESLSSDETREPICVVTDAAGAYALTDLLPVHHALTATARGHEPRGWRDPATNRDDSIELAPGEARTGVDFTLAPGGAEVAGIVEDVTGGPIAGAMVSASANMFSRGASGAVTRTDDQGRFTLWTRAGGVTVTAAAEGYAAGSAEGAAPSRELTIVLTPESSLAGTVVAADDGHPIAGATVSVGGDFFDGGASWGRARTDEQGRFRFSRLAPGRYKPSAQSAGYYGEPAESVLLGLGQAVEGVVIPVAPASQVSGVVVVEAGGATTPCPSPSVMLNDATADRREWGRGGKDGVVRVDAVLPGHYEVTVTCEHQVAEERYPAIDVVAGRDVDGLTWKVKAGATLTGVVKRADGTPVADVDVMATSTAGGARARSSSGYSRTGDDGTFRIDGLLGGTYLVRASRDGERAPMPPPTAKVEPGGTAAIEIVFLASGSIAGTVVDTDGKPVRAAQVRATGSTGSFRNLGYSGDDGAFRLDGVEPGNQRVTASLGWSQALRRPGTTDDDKQGERVTVVAGQTATTRLVVEARTGTIAGTVKDSAGVPVVDAWVMATRESDAAGAAAGGAMRGSRWSWGRSDRPVVTALDGSFTVRSLAPGTYAVRAYRRGGGEALAEHVAIGASVTLTIPSTGSIAGTVTVAGGAVPDELEISLEDEKTGFSRSESFYLTRGVFALRDLPAGTFVLTADAAGGRAMTTIELTAGQDRTGIALTLEQKLTVRGRFVDLDTQAPVPGIAAGVSAVRGAGGTPMFFGGDENLDSVSGDDGRFTAKSAPSGLVYIEGSPRDFMGSSYSFTRWVVEVTGGPEVDVGDIPVPKRRFQPGEKTGDLGFRFAESPPDEDPRQRVLKVSFVRPDGPAARAGLVVGDVVVSIDSHDVRGARATLSGTLLRARVGTTLKLGLARDVTVSVTGTAD